MKTFKIHREKTYYDAEEKADEFKINENGDLILFIDTKAVRAYAKGHWLNIKEDIKNG